MKLIIDEAGLEFESERIDENSILCWFNRDRPLAMEPNLDFKDYELPQENPRKTLEELKGKYSSVYDWSRDRARLAQSWDEYLTQKVGLAIHTQGDLKVPLLICGENPSNLYNVLKTFEEKHKLEIEKDMGALEYSGRFSASALKEHLERNWQVMSGDNIEKIRETIRKTESLERRGPYQGDLLTRVRTSLCFIESWAYQRLTHPDRDRFKTGWTYGGRIN